MKNLQKNSTENSSRFINRTDLNTFGGEYLKKNKEANAKNKAAKEAKDLANLDNETKRLLYEQAQKEITKNTTDRNKNRMGFAKKEVDWADPGVFNVGSEGNVEMDIKKLGGLDWDSGDIVIINEKRFLPGGKFENISPTVALNYLMTQQENLKNNKHFKEEKTTKNYNSSPYYYQSNGFIGDIEGNNSYSHSPKKSMSNGGEATNQKKRRQEVIPTANRNENFANKVKKLNEEQKKEIGIAETDTNDDITKKTQQYLLDKGILAANGNTNPDRSPDQIAGNNTNSALDRWTSGVETNSALAQLDMTTNIRSKLNENGQTLLNKLTSAEKKEIFGTEELTDLAEAGGNKNRGLAKIVKLQEFLNKASASSTPLKPDGLAGNKTITNFSQWQTDLAEKQKTATDQLAQEEAQKTKDQEQTEQITENKTNIEEVTKKTEDLTKDAVENIANIEELQTSTDINHTLSDRVKGKLQTYETFHDTFMAEKTSTQEILDKVNKITSWTWTTKENLEEAYIDMVDWLKGHKEYATTTDEEDRAAYEKMLDLKEITEYKIKTEYTEKFLDIYQKSDQIITFLNENPSIANLSTNAGGHNEDFSKTFNKYLNGVIKIEELIKEKIISKRAIHVAELEDLHDDPHLLEEITNIQSVISNIYNITINENTNPTALANVFKNMNADYEGMEFSDPLNGSTEIDRNKNSLEYLAQVENSIKNIDNSNVIEQDSTPNPTKGLPSKNITDSPIIEPVDTISGPDTPFIKGKKDLDPLDMNYTGEDKIA